MNGRYNDFNTYLRSLYGCRVQKITVDAGLSCPNRDGTLSTGGCIYCNARGSGTGAFARGLSVTEQLMQGKQALARRYKAKKFLAYLGMSIFLCIYQAFFVSLGALAATEGIRYFKGDPALSRYVSSALTRYIMSITSFDPGKWYAILFILFGFFFIFGPTVACYMILDQKMGPSHLEGRTLERIVGFLIFLLTLLIPLLAAYLIVKFDINSMKLFWSVV